MSYDLISKKGKDYRMGMFTWPHILNETGACYVLNYGENTVKIAQYYYDDSKKMGSPVSNDGYKVTANEARMMAVIFRGYVFIKKCILKDWEQLTPLEQEYIREKWPYKVPPSEEYLNKVEALAEFCEQSGGFKIH